MSVSFEWDKKKWDSFTRKIQRKVSKPEIDKTLKATAYEGQREFVKTLQSKSIDWVVLKDGAGYTVASTNKVALFLEDGTKAHGPVNAKYLYIPLRPNAAVWRRGLVRGKDFILTKRVKGIKARKYLKPVSNVIAKKLVDNFTTKLKQVGL